MKILWFNHRDPKHPEAGGAEVRIREVGKRLVRMGCSVRVVCERWAGSEAVEFFDGVEVVRVAGRYGLHFKVPFLLNGDGDFDVVVDDVAHAVPWFSSLFTRKPVVGQIHHLHGSVLGLELPAYSAGLVALGERSLKYFYRVFVAVSASTKRGLIEGFGIPGDRVFVIPNGVDFGLYRAVCGKFSVPTVLWVGRVKRYKRVDHVLRAFRIVKKRVPEARLVIVGDGDYLPFLKRLAEWLGLDDVVFVGRVSEEEKVRFMSGAWVVVCASVVEGWGLTVTEAAACGTPCVGYDVDGLRDSVVDGFTGFLAGSGDVGDLAGKIVRVLEDEVLRRRLSRNALEHAKKFSWDKTAEEFMKVLEWSVNEG
jgi:glycosyltransferase involved in cell wall biosynthesis